MIYGVYALLGKIVKAFEAVVWPNRGNRRPVPGHTLYHFYVSPYARRARVAIYRLGLDIPMKDVLTDERACDELIRSGGKDQVPCLKIESKGGTRWMYESADIVSYLKTI
jgi:glutaredoxin 2